MTDATRPGWRRDPYARHELRYWDGLAWTPHVSDLGVEGQDPVFPILDGDAREYLNLPSAGRRSGNPASGLDDGPSRRSRTAGGTAVRRAARGRRPRTNAPRRPATADRRRRPTSPAVVALGNRPAAAAWAVGGLALIVAVAVAGTMGGTRSQILSSRRSAIESSAVRPAGQQNPGVAPTGNGLPDAGVAAPGGPPGPTPDRATSGSASNAAVASATSATNAMPTSTQASDDAGSTTAQASDGSQAALGTPASTSSGALATLAGLPIRDDDTATPPATAFGLAEVDADGNGCDTTDDVLRRDLTRPWFTRGGCQVLGGTLHDPYTGDTVTFSAGTVPAEVVVDHVVSLADAWRSGAAHLDATRRQALAHDPLDLVATSASAAKAKGDADAASWLPPGIDLRCAYVARQIAVKSAYGLSVTIGEARAMRTVLARCQDQRLPTAAQVTPPPVGQARSTATPTPTATDTTDTTGASSTTAPGTAPGAGPITPTPTATTASAT